MCYHLQKKMAAASTLSKRSWSQVLQGQWDTCRVEQQAYTAANGEVALVFLQTQNIALTL